MILTVAPIVYIHLLLLAEIVIDTLIKDEEGLLRFESCRKIKLYVPSYVWHVPFFVWFCL